MSRTVVLFLPVVGCLWMWSAPAAADLTPLDVRMHGRPSAAVGMDLAFTCAAARPGHAAGNDSSSPFGDLFRNPVLELDLVNFASDSAAARDVRVLPPLPGSAALFLSAVFSMGGWHLVRSARHAHWSNLPEWYHTGAPIQIGHVVRFDLEPTMLPLCRFEPAGPLVDRHPFRLHGWPDRLGPRDGWTILLTAAPRGPPRFA